MKISSKEEKSIVDLNILPEYKEMLIKDVTVMNNECDKLIRWKQQDSKDYEEIIRKYPNCAVNSPAQECMCDMTCLRTLFNDINWGKCYMYDLSDIYNLKDYKDCNGATHRPKSNLLMDYRFGFNVIQSAKRLNLYLNELCEDPLIFEKLKCATYELRDECLNSKECTKSALSIENKTCSNDLYLEQIAEVYEILLNFPENSNEDHDEVIGVRLYELNGYKHEEKSIYDFGRSLKQVDENSELNSYDNESEDNFKLINPRICIFGIWCLISLIICFSKSLKFNKKVGMMLISGILSFIISSSI